MKLLMITLFCSVFIFGCKSDNKGSSDLPAKSSAKGQAGEQSAPMMNQQMNPQSTTSSISISDDVLAEIDSAIRNFSDELNSSIKKYETDKSLSNKSMLIESYIRYADYMQYESPVSPMKGKYRKALSLYRKAIELDAGNSKVMAEIAQIEDIYKSMGRPIPKD